MPRPLVEALAAKGHRIRPIARWANESGAGQMIMRLADGYVAASESRRDGYVAVM